MATNAFRRLFEVKQEHGESITDYTKRFEETWDTFKGLVGKDILHGFCEKTTEYKKLDSDEKEDMKKKSFEEWMAHLYLANADQNKCGSVVKGPHTQHTIRAIED